jgi:hypothetical protein
MSPIAAKSDVSRVVASLVVLCIAQIFFPVCVSAFVSASGLWCMGQVASAPSGHTHVAASADTLAQNTTGMSAWAAS